MTDAPVLPPTASTPATSATTNPAPTPVTLPAPQGTVSLPATLLVLPQLPNTVPPRISGQTPATQTTQTQNVTIQTQLGDIVVQLQSKLLNALPPATPLTVALPQNPALNATVQVFVPRTALSQLTNTPAPALPLPAPTVLPVGSSFNAFPLPPAPSAPNITPAFINQTFNFLGTETLPRLQSLLPNVAPNILKQFVQAKDPFSFLQNLDTPIREAITKNFPDLRPAQNTAPSILKAPEQSVQITIASLPIQIKPNTPPPLPGLVLAEIESFTPAGYPVLKTAEGSFVLKTDTPAPPAAGTKIWVNITTPNAAPISAKPVIPGLPDLSFASPLQAKTWQGLIESLDEVTTQNQQLAQNILQSIPNPVSSRIVPTTLFFLAALRSGNIQNWIGETAIEILNKSGKKDAAEKLAGDFQRLSQTSKQTQDGEWKSFTIPMRHDNDINLVQILVRHNQDENAPQDKPEAQKRKSTRFILNLSLSRMGDIQMDGLMRQKQMDLILRTQNALPANLRHDLTAAYARGLRQTGMEGGISFQNRSDSWVRITTTDKNVFA